VPDRTSGGQFRLERPPGAAGGDWVEPPRLPIPDLEDTCRHYLEIAEPLSTAAELARTSAAVSAFLSGPGPALQAQLHALDARAQTSFVHDFWCDVYLRNRAPLAIEQNVAGGVAMPQEWCRAPRAVRAASVALAVMDFMVKASLGQLPQDRENGLPLCMLQYRGLSGSVRIPGADVDSMRADPLPSHCIVAWRGAFFPLPLLREGRLEDAAAVAERIGAILRWQGETTRIGALTAGERVPWAGLRDRIAAANRPQLDAIETAAFALCIDEDAPDTAAGRAACWLMASANRWFDKTIQVIVSDSDFVGCNIEHASADGFLGARLAQHLLGFIARNPLPRPPAIDAGAGAEPLRWQLDEQAVNAVENAERQMRRANQRLRIRAFDVPSRSRGVRGDVAAQLAIQVAYFELMGQMHPVYQPVHMRHFRAGRTEAVRPVTAATLAFCRQAADPAHERAAMPLARRAMRDIAGRASRCRAGRGIDRHMLALYYLAVGQGLVIDLFEDPSYYRLMGPSIVCTSSMAGAAGLDSFAFGPVRPDGFGIAYIAYRDRTAFCVTAWRSDLDALCEGVGQALPRVARLAALRPAMAERAEPVSR